MNITPEQARELIDGATPGPWRALHDQWEDEDGTTCDDFYVLGGPDAILNTEDFDPDTHDPVANTALAAAAPDLAQTIAGMREEWAVEMYHDVDDTWRQYTTWVATREGASQHLTADLGWARQYRLVRRFVGPVEVAE